MQHVALVLLILAVTAPGVQATVTCPDVRYGSDQYRAGMQQLARQANLPAGRYTKYHERVVNNLCQGDSDDNRKLVDLGYVSAKDVASLQRVLSRKASNEALTAAPAEKKGDARDLQAMVRSINGAFIQWSSQWMWDRYVVDSAAITENQNKNDVMLVRGTFMFTRGGATATIPYASALQKQQEGWAVASLCYNDTTSGMTDCANSGTSAAARRFMRAVVVGGLISAMVANGNSRGVDVDRGTYSSVDQRRRHEEELQREERGRQEAQDTADWYNKMREPNPMLEPPKTIN